MSDDEKDAKGGGKSPQKSTDGQLTMDGILGMGDIHQAFEGTTEHAADAQDFSDEDELAEEEGSKLVETAEKDEKEAETSSDDSDNLMKELEQEGMQGVEEAGAAPITTELFGGLGMSGPEPDANETKPVDVEMTEEEKKRAAELKKKKDEKLLRIFYPTFRRGKPIKMQTLFPVVPLEFPYQQPPPVGEMPLIPTKVVFDIQTDTRKSFRMSGRQKQPRRNIPSLAEPRVVSLDGLSVDDLKRDILIHRGDVDMSTIEDSKAKDKGNRKKHPLTESGKDLVLATSDWNDTDIVDGNLDSLTKRQRNAKAEYNNVDDVEMDSELDPETILDGKLDLSSIDLRLDLNDPALLFEDEAAKKLQRKKRRLAATTAGEKLVEASIPLTVEQLDSRFNVSNDKAYEILKKNYHSRVRSTIGNLTIEHTPPANRLQSPFYSVKPSPRSLRMFHRPRFTVRSNTTMLFSRPRTRRRKRDRGKDVSQLFPETENLTVGDTAQFFMLEYSEEHPVAMNKLGMGSKIINYYRKVSEGDTSRPKLPIGETHVLGLEDRSPFWNFGFVERGNIVPTLYNQMIRAPIFKHDSSPTDFLLVRSAGAGSSQRYFIKAINNLYTVGQTFPSVEVPGPHSRKVSAISKNRLKMIVYRILNADEHQRLLVKDISRHFPEHTDMQNRQRLKEFMEYQRSGEDQGFWKLKSHKTAPGYDATREMISAEDICLLESMKFAKQHYKDIKMFRRERLENGQDKEVGKAEELQEMEMAPWNTTRNFIQATQGKAMLQIHGKGDPSGCGNAFSFLKISMKGGFLKNVENDGSSNTSTAVTKSRSKKGEKSSNTHSYNVAEQQKLYDQEISKVWYRQQRALGSRGPREGHPRRVGDDELKDNRYMRVANQRVNTEVSDQPRYLKITRMVKNSYGILERHVDIVKDPKVVELYVKKRQARLLEDPTELDSNSAVLTNDAEENMKVKKRLEQELAKLQKIQEKKKKKPVTNARIDARGRLNGRGVGKGKSTTRRCATCGMLGHIRTNKCCPLYYTIHNKSNPNYVPGSEKSAHLLKMTQQKKE